MSNNCWQAMSTKKIVTFKSTISMENQVSVMQDRFMITMAAELVGKEALTTVVTGGSG